MFTDIDRNYVTYNSYEALNYILALEEIRLRQKASSLPQSQLCFNMPNYFRERLGPLLYSTDRRTKLRLIRWMQRKRLLKRNIRCARCGNRMQLAAKRRTRDKYQW